MASSGLKHVSSCQKTSRSSCTDNVELATVLFGEPVLQTADPALKQSLERCCPTAAKASRSSQSSGASLVRWGLVGPNAAWAVCFPHWSTSALVSAEGWWPSLHEGAKIQRPSLTLLAHLHIYGYTLYCLLTAALVVPAEAMASAWKRRAFRLTLQRKPVAEQGAYRSPLVWPQAQSSRCCTQVSYLLYMKYLLTLERRSREVHMGKRGVCTSRGEYMRS